tara:strand:+ start:189 stop:338 length:150 start_codon:yes stop_codon:yes gene_type:complete
MVSKRDMNIMLELIYDLKDDSDKTAKEINDLMLKIEDVIDENDNMSGLR